MVDYRELARQEAIRNGIPVDLFLAQINQESGWNPNAVSSAGAIGLGQLMPGTASDLGVDPTNPAQNLAGAARYLSQQYKKFGDWNTALAAYNAGPGAVQKYGGIPPYKETQNYVKSIMGRLGSGADVAADTMQALGKGKTMTPMVPTAAPQQERKGFLGGLLSDPDLMDRLAIGFAGMTLNPNVGLQQLAASRIASRAEERNVNKTVEMLKRMEADPKLIELAQAGYAKEAIGLAYAQPKAPEFMEVNGKIVKIDPTTGAATEVFAGGPDAKAIAEARKEFTGLKPVKDFADQSVAYSRIIKSIEDPSPSGDLALIFNFMKVLDPGSVVREGEFATAQNAGSVDERVRGLYNRVISGERLTPEQRADFADRATRLYQGGLQEYGALSEQYSAFAKAAGLPVEQVIPSFGYSGPLYRKPLEFQRPPAPPGVPPAEWTAAWSAMTDEERAQFLNGGQP